VHTTYSIRHHPTLYANHVRCEVFTAVTMNKIVFWDVMPCRFCVNRRFEGTYRLHLQGSSLADFLPWRWRQYIPQKRRFTEDLHDATTQKTVFFFIPKSLNFKTCTHSPITAPSHMVDDLCSNYETLKKKRWIIQIRCKNVRYMFLHNRVHFIQRFLRHFFP
jgi:hypothetical protein